MNNSFYDNTFKVKSVKVELDKKNGLKRVLLILDNNDNNTSDLVNALKPLLKNYEEKIRK